MLPLLGSQRKTMPGIPFFRNEKSEAISGSQWRFKSGPRESAEPSVVFNRENLLLAIRFPLGVPANEIGKLSLSGEKWE
jgi:hypothetical protein